MKAKVIWWGWVASWFFLFAGIGTWENAAFGSLQAVIGVLLFCVWFGFSLLLIANEKECLAEADRMERWMDKMILKVSKDLNINK